MYASPGSRAGRGRQFGLDGRLIREYILTGSSSGFTFDNIPQIFNRIEMEFFARGNVSAVEDTLALRFNGDSGSNYDWQQIFGGNASVSGVRGNATSSLSAMPFPAATGQTSAWGSGILRLTEYTRTEGFRPYTFDGGYYRTGSDFRTMCVAGQWRSLAPITSITIFTAAASTFVDRSTFRFYGRY